MKLLICSLFISFYSMAFSQKIQIENQELVLNGIGLRLATWFNIEVYKGALYLKQKEKDPNKILNTDSTKMVEMSFLRDVSVDKIRSAWIEGLNKKYEVPLKKLNTLMEDMHEEESMKIVFHLPEVSIYVKGKHKGRVKGKEFSRALLAIFIGENPPNKELKNGMLGL